MYRVSRVSRVSGASGMYRVSGVSIVSSVFRVSRRSRGSRVSRVSRVALFMNGIFGRFKPGGVGGVRMDTKANQTKRNKNKTNIVQARGAGRSVPLRPDAQKKQKKNGHYIYIYI